MGSKGLLTNKGAGEMAKLFGAIGAALGDGEKAVALETQAGQPVRYEGVLRGLVAVDEATSSSDGCCWAFEGVGYSTPADEATVMATVGEALEEPERPQVACARLFMFGQPCGFTYTSQALLAMLVAYEDECSVDGEDEGGVRAVTSILREAARRIAVVEALTI